MPRSFFTLITPFISNGLILLNTAKPLPDLAKDHADRFLRIRPDQASGRPQVAPAPEDGPAEAPQDAPKGEVKDADVRKALNALIKAGKRDEVKAILKSFGAENFSKLTANQYPAVLKKAKEALGDD